MQWRIYRVVKVVTLLMLACLLPLATASADVSSVSASVDKNPAMADESVVLTVVAMGDADNNGFDPSVLATDFVVGRTSISTQTRVVNFDATRSTTWSTVLIPRRQGTFTIPSFTIGGKSTQPITLRVIPASAASPNQARDVFLTAQADVTNPYVQQVVKYTIKIHLAADLQRGNLPNPVVNNAEILPLGKDKEYSDIIDGQRYRIIERTFAIVPQNSGEITIKGPLFEGEMVDKSRSSFSYFNQTKVINRVVPDVVLDVQPIPATVDEHWLPSEMVQLNEEWQPAVEEITVGEPITRTITLSVLGVAQEQLPEIVGNYPPDFKVYPDQATTSSTPRDDNIVAQRVENVALIPNKPGTFVLPEVIVPWFNVITNEVQQARLPARSIEVRPAAAGSNVTQPALPEAALQPQSDKPLSPMDELTGPAMTQQTQLWSLSSWILLAVWLTTLFIWWWSAQRNQATVTAPTVRPETVNSEQETWQQLQKALKTRQANQIIGALQQWLNSLVPGRHQHLSQLQSKLADEQLNEQINLLLASRYAQGDNQWETDKLKQQLTRIRQSKREQNKQTNSLSSLYD